MIINNIIVYLIETKKFLKKLIILLLKLINIILETDN